MGKTTMGNTHFVNYGHHVDDDSMQGTGNVNFLRRALLDLLHENVTLHRRIFALQRDRAHQAQDSSNQTGSQQVSSQQEDCTPKPTKLCRGRSILVCSPLLIAAKTNDTETLEQLLQQGTDANSTAENGATAVYVAAEQDNADALRVLLLQGADPNRPLSIGCGFTPVYVATLRNHTNALEVLLQAGADPNVAICGMLKPMDVAAKSHNTAAVAMLQDYGAQPLCAAGA